MECRNASKVLDLGCSDGVLSAQLKSFGHMVTGIDLEEHPNVHKHVEKFMQANLDVGLPEDLSSQFDVVICADVLEHVRQPEVLLSQIAERFGPQCVVLASIPNFSHWYPRFRTF